VQNAEVLRFARLARPFGTKYYFEFWLTTSGGKRFFMRRPQGEQLSLYQAAIPIGRPMTLHYRETHEGNQLVDLRDESKVYIPLSEVLGVEAGKRLVLLVCAAIFAAVGIVGVLFSSMTKPRAPGRRRTGR
jgi:hypothetical protein